MNRIEQLTANIAESQANIRKAQAELYTLTKTVVDPVVAKANRKAAKQLKYATSNGLTVYGLRQQGFDVGVTHIRNAHVPGVEHPVPVPSYLKHIHPLAARGGATHIVIGIQDKNKPETVYSLLAVTSVCHEIDSFDYKLGVKTALDQITPEDLKYLTTCLTRYQTATPEEIEKVCGCGHAKCCEATA